MYFSKDILKPYILKRLLTIIKEHNKLSLIVPLACYRCKVKSSITEKISQLIYIFSVHD